MAWMKDDSQSRTLKPSWDYSDSLEAVTILPETTRSFLLISGDNDPTGTWTDDVGPLAPWIHQFKNSAGKFVTMVCDRYTKACPMCFENEIFKLANPNYKDNKQRLPYAVMKKAVIQVYDFELKKVLLLIAGKSIQDGMDFVLTRNAAHFAGLIAVTRTGKGFNTNYRVDLDNTPITPEDLAIIKANTKTRDEVSRALSFSDEDFIKKSGFDPTSYFERMLPLHPEIDVSDWGVIPKSIVVNKTPASPPTTVSVDTKTPLNNDSLPFGNIKSMEDAKAVISKTGMTSGMTLGEVLEKQGTTHIEFLSKEANNDLEKEACEFMIKSGI